MTEQLEGLVSLRASIAQGIASLQAVLEETDKQIAKARKAKPKTEHVYHIDPIDRRIGIDEVLDILRLSRTTLYEEIKKGRIPAGHGKGKGHYWLLSEIQDVLKRERTAV